MLRKLVLGLVGAFAVAGAAASFSTPAEAQWGGRHFGGPQFAGPPAFGHRHHRRCWDRPVRVWNGWRHVMRYERVCRGGWGGGRGGW
mgnify:CR=1 FL=1